MCFGDEDITALAEPQRTRFRRTHIGFIYQFFNLVPTLMSEENVRLDAGAEWRAWPCGARASAAMLAEVGLGIGDTVTSIVVGWRTAAGGDRAGDGASAAAAARG